MRVESVELVPDNSVFAPRWDVSAGEEAWSLLKHQEKLSEQSRQNIMDDAVAILSQCLPPSESEGQETGLVLGYVQSGKTLSFTTVTALARDNGYPLVIVIAGTSLPLSGQSLERLNDDLRLDKRSDRQWLPIHNPSIANGDVSKILNVIENWRDTNVPASYKQTALITVMKHYQHLLNLSNVLDGLPLHGVPTLVIDDEADQAGLNSKVRQGGVSTTHQNLAVLRNRLPHHTFLQYTATPQALLLINMLNTLSPNFCYVLEPGEDYVGGKHFFTANSPYIRTIPVAEVPTRDDRLLEPPKSLIEAMRVFLVGVAAGYIENAKKDNKRKHHRNRSMMVHPSMETDRHNDYLRWVEQIKSRWAETLGLPEDEPDRQDLMAEFREAYDELRETEQDIPAFEEVASWYLKHAITSTQTTRMNASRGRTPTIDWKNVYAHILVGGQAMNRGFTVEGLTITYMPRGVGGRNADTIQQRARFFGHKRNILGYCRVYLEQETEESFHHYIQHEESVRKRIIEFNQSKRPLNEWKRAFVLDGSLWPTRRSVLDQDYDRDRVSDDWYSTRVPHDSMDAVVSNKKAIEDFRQNFTFSLYMGHHPGTRTLGHLVNQEVPLKQLVNDLLLQLRMTDAKDSNYLAGILVQIEEYLRLDDTDPNEKTHVYLMTGGKPRKRGISTNNQVKELFQGKNPKIGPINYPGDRYIDDEDVVKVQIHCLNIEEGGVLLFRDVPAFGIWLPQRIGSWWWAQ